MDAGCPGEVVGPQSFLPVISQQTRFASVADPDSTDSSAEPVSPVTDSTPEQALDSSGTSPLPEQATLETVASPSDDELPDYEILTPELLEDECIRGDVMLRWAVVLLSVLLGWTLLTETPLLVNIRSGEWMLSHGFLPPRVDSFSATAAGRAWVNLSWLSDLTLAAVYRAAGFGGLSVLCAMTVGLSFWILSRLNLPGISTWWNSTCSALALLALFPVFQPGESTATVLGLSALMLLLDRLSREQTAASAWKLVPLCLLWTNFDSRCWLGLLILLLFVLGELISGAWSHPLRRRGVIWAGGALAAGLLLSPWPFQPALQWKTAWRTEFEIREYLGISEFFHRLDYTPLHPAFWRSLDVFVIPVALLFVISIVTLILNARRVQLGWLFVWLAVNGLSLAYGDFVAYAAIVNAAVAIVCGQDWYRNSFSVDYSITTWNVVSSRAGRAVMVLGFFLLAYLAVNGALMGPQGRRIGTGLDPRWEQRIVSLRDEVLPHTSSTRNFPTLPMQGDLLIWLDHQPFVDSRIGLYVSGETNLLQLHRDTRAAVFPGKDAEADPERVKLWRNVFAEYEVKDVFVRLWGITPAYGAFFQLFEQPEWVLTGLGSAGANLTCNLPDDAAQQAHLKKYGLQDFAQLGFRPETAPQVLDLQAIWPLPASKYDRWMIQKLTVAPSASELARHYMAILQESGHPYSAQAAAGLCLLAQRSARQGMQANPNDPLAYRIFGDAAQILTQVEQSQLGDSSQQPPVPMLRTQILSSAFSSVVASQDQPTDLFNLFQLLLSERSVDTALNVLDRYDRAAALHPESRLPVERRIQLETLRGQLEETVTAAREEVEKGRVQNLTMVELAAIAMSRNCPHLALSILEQDLTQLAADPQVQLFYATLLLGNGRLEDAYDQVESLQAKLHGPQGNQMPPYLASQLRNTTIRLDLAVQNLQRVVKLSDEEKQDYWKTAIRTLLEMPFGSMQFPQQMILWPALETRLTYSAAVEIPERWASVQLQAARAEIQLGQLKAAETRLKQILDQVPEFSQRTVVALYWTGLSGQTFAFPKPLPELPVYQRSEKTSSEKSSNTPSGKPAPENLEMPLPPDSPPLPVQPPTP